MAEIGIDVQAVGETVSPLLFGHNLEHTRSSMWQGLSAQLIQNRKFAGTPQKNGVAQGWQGIGGEDTFFLLDAYDCLRQQPVGYTRHYDPSDFRRHHEINAQRVESMRGVAQAGIAQGGVALQAGVPYELRLVVKTNRPMPLSVLVGNSAGGYHFQTTVDESTPEHWNEYQWYFTPSAEDENAQLELTFSSRGAMTVGAVSLMRADNFLGLRQDVIACLEEISVPILRWPGGNFAGDYRWQDGLLPVDQRAPLGSYTPIMTEPHTFGYDMHEIGTDEFIALCRRLKAEPFITINIGNESPELTAAWVEYCNGSPATKWGAVRAERGHPQPYNVRYWSLGNELGHGGHVEGPNEPEEYAQVALRYAQAMRAVDPSLVLISSGAWERASQHWATPEVLGVLRRSVDMIAYHHYSQAVERYTDSDVRQRVRRTVLEASQLGRKFALLREKLDAVTGPDHRVGISVDEWNVWGAWSRKDDVADGLHTAAMLNMFIREAHAQKIEIGCYCEPTQTGINISSDRAALTPAGEVFALFRAHRGKRLLQLPDRDPEDDIDLAVTCDEQTVVVTVINRNIDEPRRVTLKIDKTTVVEGLLLRGEGYQPGSSFARLPLDVESDRGRSTFTLPPLSLARITFGRS